MYFTCVCCKITCSLSFYIEPTMPTFTARLFYMSSVSGVFKSTEIMNPCKNNEDICVPFPFRQADLYNQPQPGKIHIHSPRDTSCPSITCT